MTTATDQSMRETGARLARALADVESAVGPNAWGRVESLVTELVSLYGEGLVRLLAHARASARDPGELEASLSSDEVVASLLSLHGAHPIPLDRRLERAMDRVRDAIGEARVEIERVSDDEVTVRASGVNQAIAATNLTALVAKAIEREAPEIASVRVDGLAAAPPEKLLGVDQLVRRGAR
jgi:hypothetical protein